MRITRDMTAIASSANKSACCLLRAYSRKNTAMSDRPSRLPHTARMPFLVSGWLGIVTHAIPESDDYSSETDKMLVRAVLSY